MISKKGANRFNIPGTALRLAGISIAMVSTASFAGATGLTGFGSAILEAGNGSVVVSGNGTTGGCIIWYNGGSPPTTCPTTGAGNLTVEAGSTLPFNVGDTGTIDNLNFNTALPLVGFMVIDNAPNTPATIDFDLEDIRFNGATAIGGCSGSAATSAGDTCTPANSPFTLTNGLVDPSNGMVDTVSIAMTVDAWGYTGSSGTDYSAATAYIGIFTTQQAIQGANIQSILTTIADGDSVNASWSATFTPVSEVPEAPSFILAGAGLLGIGCFRRNAHRH
jgi:hypothetical protein